MLMYILFLLSFGILIYITAIREKDWTNILPSFTVSMFITLSVTGLVSAILFAIKPKWPDTYTITSTVTVPIVSLRNDTSISGQFFLGSGIINGEEKYFFVRKLQEQNSYMKDSIPTAGVVLIENNEVAPNYTYDLVTRTSHKNWNYIRPVFLSDDVKDVKCNFRLTVPKNTIIQHFEVK